MKRILLGIVLAALIIPVAGCYVVYHDDYHHRGRYYRPYYSGPYFYPGPYYYYHHRYYNRFED